MPKLTAANCKILANAKRLYNAKVYANCLAIANDGAMACAAGTTVGAAGVLAYLSVFTKTTVTDESLAAAVASLADRAREAAAAGKRLPVGATRA